MKKTLLASLISATSLFVCCGPVLAADYYVVVPSPGKAAQLAAINVGLNSYTIPEAIVGSAYAGFDFKSVLSVTGDSAYNGSLVSWSVVSGALPAGLVLNADGTLSGTPTLVGTSNFTLKATYKTKMGQQAYQVVSLGITVGLATATLPAAKVNTAYAAFDFKPLLTVSGDPNYSASNVTFSATGLPVGMAMSSAGVLSGTPTTQSAGSSFQVVAAYKTKTGQQAYTIAVNSAVLEATQIAMGGWHSCALTTSGGVKCWGYNSAGQLGDGTTTQKTTPVDVVGLTFGVVALSAGNNHTCALLATGGVKCWGSGSVGQLGNNATTSKTTPVDVSGLTSGVQALSPRGHDHTCAITTSGAAKCWGSNVYGQLGNNSTTNSSVPVPVSGLSSGVAAVYAAGGDGGSLDGPHSCAIVSGALWCWGRNNYGQLGDGTTNNAAVPVAVSGLSAGVASASLGGAHTCALTTSGGAKCWGLNSSSQLGDSSATTRTTPVDVKNLTAGVFEIKAAYQHTCAITTSGQALCWGSNNNGQLGTGNTTTYSIPTAVLNMSSGVSALSLGSYHTCAVVSAAGVKCWGSNANGRLGDGTTANRSSPVDVTL